MGKLTGKVALITGGGQGVGLGIAHAFAAEGASIVLTGRTADKLKLAADALTARHGIQTLTVAGDVRKRASAEEAVAATKAKFGRLDVLVNNAQSSSITSPIETITDEDFAMNLESGLWGTLYFMQNAFPLMKAQGGGKVINFVSRRGLQCSAGAGPYAAAKEAIRALSRVAAREWGQHNIQVNCISPAAVSPPSTKLAKEQPEVMKKILSEMALGRLGDPEVDIGRVALFLATEMSDFVTGQTLCADGGIMMM